MTNSLSFKTAWISDLHLGTIDCQVDFLLEFLQALECETLFLVGDIIDIIALKKRQNWKPEHYQVLKIIQTMTEQGTRVIYIPGNHDAIMRQYVGGNILNIEIMHQYIHEGSDGKRYLVTHGDELDHQLLGRRLHYLIGNTAYDVSLFLNRWTRRIRNILGLPYWSMSTYLKTHVRKAREAIETFEASAAKLAKTYGADGIICGHIHKPHMREIDGIRYCNDGDWTESCSALVQHADGTMEIIYWPEQRNKHTTATELPVAA